MFLPKLLASMVGLLLVLLAFVTSLSCVGAPESSGPASSATTASVPLPSTTTSSHPAPSVPASVSTTNTTVLVPAVDFFLGQLRLEVNPREGVRVAVGGLREVESDQVGPRKRVIEGELIIENESMTSFAYGPADFRLYVGPFQFQIEGMTASTELRLPKPSLPPSWSKAIPSSTRAASSRARPCMAIF